MASPSSLAAQHLTSAGRLRRKRTRHQLARKFTGSLHQLNCYLRVDDPYSYLLIQALVRLQQTFPAVEIQPKLVFTLPDHGLYPDPERLAALALTDAQRLARRLGLRFSYQQGIAGEEAHEQALLASRILLNQETEPDFFATALMVFDAFWQNNPRQLEEYAHLFGVIGQRQSNKLLSNRTQLLLKEGHYLTATIHYDGEWYWGVDRLGYLVERLAEQNLAAPSADLEWFKQLWQPLSAQQPAEKFPLDFYFSFRSPYSYLAVERVFALADHYQLELNIKPVLPMVMRGMAVPPIKKFYILSDAAREARRLQIPFGCISDPLGPGIKHCLALFEYAKQQGRQREFIQAISQAIWSDGININNRRPLKLLLEPIGLDWHSAQGFLGNSQVLEQAESNRQALLEMGIWGAPGFHYRGHSFWGQDRLWALEQCIQHNGETQ